MSLVNLSTKYSTTGDRLLRSSIDFHLKRLQVHKELSASELSIFQNKVNTLMASSDKKWADCRANRKVAAEKDPIKAEDKLEELHEAIIR